MKMSDLLFHNKKAVNQSSLEMTATIKDFEPEKSILLTLPHLPFGIHEYSCFVLFENNT